MVQTNPIKMNVIVSKKRDIHCLEVRRTIMNYDLMKQIILSALNEEAMVIFPTFNDKLRSLNSMVENGIIYLEDGKYKFYE